MISRCKAAIFDMDGTLLDSMGAWRSLGAEYLRECGLPIPEDMKDWWHMTCHSCAEVISRTYPLGMDAEQMFLTLQSRLTRHYLAEVQPRPDAHRMVDALIAEGIDCCVATGTCAEIARVALDHSGFLHGMRFLVGGDDLGVGKDDPEYFRRVAAMLGRQPQECAVFEDSLYAIQAAKAAGCYVCAIAEDFAEPQRDQIVALADRYILSFSELLN